MTRSESHAPNWSGIQPTFARTAGESWEGSTPSISTRPASGASSEASISMRVDFPLPFGPTSAVTAPRGAVKLRSATACTLPKARLTCSATIPGVCGAGALGSGPGNAGAGRADGPWAGSGGMCPPGPRGA